MLRHRAILLRSAFSWLARRPDPRRAVRVVGLVPGKNEAGRLAVCLRALARVCDAIVYADDGSTDASLAVVRRWAEACRVERILALPPGPRHEGRQRSALLRAGRDLGGTHFVALDADELFTANCLEGDLLRRRIALLRPGERLELAWIQLWRSPDAYRHDASVWTHLYKPFVFADDGRCDYPDVLLHVERTPKALVGRRHRLPGYRYGVLHTQFLDWRGLRVKQAWYRCLERLADPRRDAAEINALYAPTTDERGLRLRPARPEWFAGYEFLDRRDLVKPDTWREAEIRAWIARHGEARFRDLDIWDLD